MSTHPNESTDREGIEAFATSARGLPTPPGLRDSNIASIGRVLDSPPSAKSPTVNSWWQRRISVPVPIAAAIGLLVVLQFVLSLGHREITDSPPQEASPDELIVYDEPQYEETSVYVAGIGVVETTKTFFHQENRL